MTRQRHYQPHQALSVGDGFRIGFGIAFWVFAGQLGLLIIAMMAGIVLSLGGV